MTDDSMMRGALPLMWFVLIGSIALTYDISPSDPTWGGLAAVGPFVLLPASLLLALLTFLLGSPSTKEVVAATVAGIAGSAAIAVLAAVTVPDHIVWFIVALFALVLPLSRFLFRRLILLGGADPEA